MGSIRDAFNLAFPDGPSDAPSRPNKTQIRSIGVVLEALLSALVTGVALSTVTKPVLSDLTAALNYPSGTLGVVYADGVPDKNGVYVKNGASGSGSWTKTGLLLPLDFAQDIADLDAQVATALTDLAQKAEASVVNSLIAGLAATDGRTSAINVDTPAFTKSVINDPSKRAAHAVLENGATQVTELVVGQRAGIVESGGIGRAAVTDGNGKAGWVVEDDGSVTVDKMFLKEFGFERLDAGPYRNYMPDILRKPKGYLYNTSAMTLLLMCYGQSLSKGHANTAISTGSPKYPNMYMFNGGVRPEDGAGASADQHSSFVALKESTFNDNGETPVTGMLQMFMQMLTADAATAGTPDLQLVGCAPGEGGVPIHALTSGPTWQRLVDAMNYGMAVANGGNRTIAAPGIAYVQGETDAQLLTDPTLWTTQLLEVQKNITDISSRKFGRGGLAQIALFQVDSYLESGDPNATITLAQLKASIENPGIHVAVPGYIFPCVPGDHYHRTAEATRLMGAYLGLCLYRTIIRGEMWSCVRPIETIRQGNMVQIRFHVPSPPLKFDTSITAAVANQGLGLLDPSGNPLAISSVALVSQDTIVIRAASAIPAGSYVTGGINGTSATGPTSGPRTNIFDSQGNTIAFDPTGLNIRMDNPCAIFKERLN